MADTSSERRDASPLAQRIQESLGYCSREGVMAQVMLGILDYYLIPFALFLGATTGQIGLLVAIPNLLSSVSQLVAVKAVWVIGNRHRLLLLGTGIQAIVLLAMVALPYFPVGWDIAVLVFIVSVFRVLGAMIGPAWGSLVSEYLSENRRGKYFGMRSRAIGIAGLVSVGFWGVFLHFLKPRAPEIVGFIILFLSAAFFRLASRYYISRMVDLPLQRTAESDFTLWMFLRRFRESNFVKFILFVSGITFGTQLAAPYLSVYMLEHLKFNYLQYTAVHLSSILMSFIFFPMWGRHADVVGNARILKITSAFIPIVPLLWIFSRNVYTLAAAEMFSGLIWGGFNLCATNFIYDAVSPDKRVRCLSYFSLINGAAAFAGASLGGFLAERLPPVLGTPLYSLFLLSCLVRFLSDFFLSVHFREVREGTPTVSAFDLFFSVFGLRPIIGHTGELLEYAPKRTADFRKRSIFDRRHSSREEPQGRN